MPGRTPEEAGRQSVPRGHTRCHETGCLAATLSGRAGERATLLDVVRAGLEGSPRAVLVHGEAGIGKTVLVRSVCEEVTGEGAQVLWGQSLRFGAVEAMYHPLVLALEGWLGEADDAERASVVEAVPGAALILPSLGARPRRPVGADHRGRRPAQPGDRAGADGARGRRRAVGRSGHLGRPVLPGGRVRESTAGAGDHSS